MNAINFKAILQRYPYIWCKFCAHQCECVGTKNSSFTEEQVSRNLRIGIILDCFDKFPHDTGCKNQEFFVYLK